MRCGDKGEPQVGHVFVGAILLPAKGKGHVFDGASGTRVCRGNLAASKGQGRDGDAAVDASMRARIGGWGTEAVEGLRGAGGRQGEGGEARGKDMKSRVPVGENMFEKR